MNRKQLNNAWLLLVPAVLLMGCAPELPETDSATTLNAMATNLKSVEDRYLPESISENGTVSTASLKPSISSAITSQAAEPDICDGLDFIKCQPRLLRAYLLYGRGAVAITSTIVTNVARDLSKAPDNSSGTFHDQEKNLTIEYKKRSLVDFDFLISQGGQPVGRVSANPQLYTIQFDVGILEKDKPDSRGGKIDIQVKYTDRTHWTSQIMVTDMLCNVAKPDDPETGRINVTRNGEVWSGQSMFYNGIAGSFSASKSCATAASDQTGLVVYSDFVADRLAAKAALYVLKRTETSTALIDTFGFNKMCANYPDFCQSLATTLGTTPVSVETSLNQLTNPFCMRRGSMDVTWNSKCETLSSRVADEPFLTNSNWITPYDFYRSEVVIPTKL